MNKHNFILLLLSILLGQNLYATKILSRSTNLVFRDTSQLYKNPVFVPVLADPTVFFDKSSNSFYAYGTADNWADGEGERIVPILKSIDLSSWNYEGMSFSKASRPNWKKGGIWAPEIAFVNNTYHLYYAFSVWDDVDPGIGVAISNNPLGPFVDKGKLFSSSDIEVPNSIDPFYFEDMGKKFLFWGSYSNLNTQGTYGVELEDDGLSIKDKSSKFKIAAGDWEAVVIHKRNNYYYFIGSKGSCCDGENSSYHVLVARSKSLFGPYLDKNGHDVTTRGRGTLMLKGNESIVGPGHTSRIFTDDNGDDWILYHAMEKNFPKLTNGVNRRTLFLDKIVWDNDWPIINTGTPSTEKSVKPKFNLNDKKDN